eukprot:2918658-Rhodomonas_salina.1
MLPWNAIAAVEVHSLLAEHVLLEVPGTTSTVGASRLQVPAQAGHHHRPFLQLVPALSRLLQRPTPVPGQPQAVLPAGARPEPPSSESPFQTQGTSHGRQPFRAADRRHRGAQTPADAAS